MSIRVGAIIAAAGDGRRFSKKGEKRKKQFILLGGKPLFLHSANCFFYSPIITKLIVVAPENNIEYCTDLLNGEFGANNIDVIAGGSERQESVYNAFSKIRSSVDAVIIQDGARPFINPKWIKSTIKKMKTHDGAIVALPSSDTLKFSQNSIIEKTLDRSSIWRAQTPQTFKVDILDTAYDYARKKNFVGTDESQIVEMVGGQIALIKGSAFNLKLTTKNDLILAQEIFAKGLNV